MSGGDRNDFGISLDEVLRELEYAVEQAQNFVVSEFQEDWETAEAYYKGKSYLPVEAGRSTVVKTAVRDTIRALMPNVMRVLLQSHKPVEYIPNSIASAQYVEQQQRWINQSFMADGGYTTLYSAVLEAMKHRIGPIKVFWEENPSPEAMRLTNVDDAQLMSLQEDPDIEIIDVEVVESPARGQDAYNVEATKYYNYGKVIYEAFPAFEFFIEREATDLSSLHGHRRSVTVGEAIELGLDYNDWRSLDDDDPKLNEASGQDIERRGYSSNLDESTDDDVINHKFLLTEAYCRYDMDGDGVAEHYVFYLGGSNYTYLHHELIARPCIFLVQIDPQSFSWVGQSVTDLVKETADQATSLLRIIMDNAHTANNPRPAADPMRVNFDDLMDNRIGAPIRMQRGGTIEYAEVPFTGNGLLPLLEWFERDAEIRVGVTKAARGLDPDALQSTDKKAVLNTIELSQGQVELIVRNVVETGLVPLFREGLRLSINHRDPRQMLSYKGATIPIDLSKFDPDLSCRPAVGLGTTSVETRISGLQYVLAEQEKALEKYGFDNPFVSLAQMYNAREDLLELMGVHNPGRYFNYVGVDQERAIAAMLMEAQQKSAEMQRELMPLDVGKAHVLAESFKARVAHMQETNKRAIESAKLQQAALAVDANIDYQYDQLAQTGMLESAKINNERVKLKQPEPPSSTSGDGATSTPALSEDVA